MTSPLLCAVLFKFCLPITLVAAFIFRFNGFSLLYLCCFFCIPLLPSPSVRNCRGNGTTVSFLKALIFLSGLASVVQIIFQIILGSLAPYGHFLERCSVLEEVLREIGLNRFDHVSALDICRLLLPDYIILAFSVFCWMCMRSLGRMRTRTVNQRSYWDIKFTIGLNIRNYVLPYFVLILLLVAGISVPCLISFVYFFIFLLFGTKWSLHRTLHSHYWTTLFRVRLFLMIYSGSHLLVLYFYQFQFFQSALPVKSLPARLLGLVGFVETKCNNPQTLYHRSEDLDWPHFLFVAVVVTLYWFLATEIRYDNNDQHRDESGRNSESDRTTRIESTEETAGTGDEERPTLSLKQTISSILSFLMAQSYIASLIIMMAWSIIYHSWLTFVLLLWACLIWITPFARSFCMITSPYFVLYAEALLLIQFIYGLDLNDDELPIKSASGELDYEEIGFRKWKYPCVHLAIQTLFTWVFWVTLHQHVKEKQSRTDREEFSLRPILIALTRIFSHNPGQRSPGSEASGNETSQTSHSDVTVDTILMKWINSVFSKYWILVCCGAFLLVGLQNDVSMYQIGYMAIFLFLFVCYQVSFSFWRVVLRPLWWAMVIYSVCILLVVYTYQFENMPMYWRNTTHLSDEWLYDLGLRQHTKASLLLELLTPTAFSVIIVIQLHFFHRPFMAMVDLRPPRREVSVSREERRVSLSISANHEEEEMISANQGHESIIPANQRVEDSTSSNEDPAHGTDENDTTPAQQARVLKWYNNITVLLWRLGELHMPKIISFTLITVVLSKVCAINAVIIVLLAISMPSGLIQRALSYCFLIWSSLVILAKMCYQLQFVQEDVFQHNCSNTVFPRSTFVNHFTNNALWVGFYKTKNISADIQGYLFIVLVIVFQTVISHHQKLCRIKYGSREYPNGILFPESVELEQADKGLLEMFKYLCNKFFYNFGWEVCIVTIVINMGVRCDAVSVIYSLWLGTFLVLGRNKSSSMWGIYLLFLAVMLPVQYVLVLGWPPGLCTGYPWTTRLDHNLIHWLFLTDPEDPQNAKLLLVDFFQLLLACCQEKVFADERTANTLFVSNNSPSHTITLGTVNSRYNSPDFMKNKTWLDMLKIFVFQHIYWITLTIVYITVQSTISIFNFGFILGCFFFLWHGQSLYLHAKLIYWWKIFMSYNFLVLFLKVCLQLVSCVWIDQVKDFSGCYVLQLLSLYCLRQAGYTYRPRTSAERDCVSPDDTGLSMDCACFVFLLLQYRIFTSDYFNFVKRELREQAEMASWGAQFIDQQLKENLEALKRRDKKEMEKIKRSVKKLKNKRVNQHRTQEPQSHYEAIYSGDYYLFESSEETDSDSDGSPDDSPPHPSDRRSSGVTEIGVKPEESAKHEDQPSQGETSTESEPEQPTESQTKASQTKIAVVVEKLKSVLILFLVYGKRVLDKLIGFLNELSKDYRAVARQLKKARWEKVQRDSIGDYRWRDSMVSSDGSVDNKVIKLQEDSISYASITSEQVDAVDGVGVVPNWHLMKFVRALFYAIISQTNYLCFLMMVINHVVYASVLSMMFPLFIFLWGMLSIPRPTKMFWITVITYTQIIIIIKYIFQFEFIHFNDCSSTVELRNDPLCPARIFEIERDGTTTAYDLLLLLALFFHRYALQAHGLWRGTFDSKSQDSVDNSSSFNETDATLVSEVPQDARPDDRVITMEESLLPQDSDTANKKGIVDNVVTFIKRMVDPNVGSGATDVYGIMFGCQFIIFLIILFSWSAFAETEPSSDANFAQIIEKNVVPRTFLYMVLTQFVLIMIDRALHLRKFVLGKLFYLVFLVISLHIFMFFVVPALTKRRFQDNVPAIFLYLFKCLYFGFSAYQVRCGYPTRILGNFLTKNFTLTNVVLFQGIQTIPFVLELRSLLDWVCTDSTLSLFHWLKMEDIYANIYILKCYRAAEKTQWFRHNRGAQYPSLNKWLVGGFLVFLLIVIIWFPLLFMSYINSVYTSNTPTDATFTLTIGGYQPLFKVSAQQQFLKVLTDSEVEHIKNSNRPYQGSSETQIDNFLENFKAKGNVVLVRVSGNSSSIWTISPPSRKYLVNDLLSKNTNVTLRFQWEFTREPLTALVQETISGVNSIVLSPNDTVRTNLGKMLVDSASSGPDEITIKSLFPTFIRVPASGQATALTELFNASYVDCGIRVRVGSVPNVTGEVEWWELTQQKPRPIFDSGQSTSDLEVITFNDFVPPLHFSFFASTGIIGLYVGFVWLVGKFVRLFFTSISYRIMFDEMPNVDKVFKLCLDIYMVRETKDFELEEDLFAKLMFLYRSPETLIKWTKYKRD